MRQRVSQQVSRGRRLAARSGFTLLEILFSILVIAFLMGLLIVSLRAARSFAQRSATAQTASSIDYGVTAFKNEFGFLPPLVKDHEDDLLANLPAQLQTDEREQYIKVYSLANANDLRLLRGGSAFQGSGARRYSVHSLAFYLGGALDRNVDGIDGPGMFEPDAEGSFKLGGRRVEPLIDVDKVGSLRVGDVENGKISLVDKNDVEIRYYRWEEGDPQTGEVEDFEDLNVPEVVGDPEEDASLRSARYAIVVAGPNGVFGDEPEDELRRKMASFADPITLLRSKARADNAVEVGQ